LIADVALASELEAQEPEEPAEVWVATFTDASLWNGPDSDAARIGRLPIGSYFRLTGESIG